MRTPGARDDSLEVPSSFTLDTNSPRTTHPFPNSTAIRRGCGFVALILLTWVCAAHYYAPHRLVRPLWRCSSGSASRRVRRLPPAVGFQMILFVGVAMRVVPRWCGILACALGVAASCGAQGAPIARPVQGVQGVQGATGGAGRPAEVRSPEISPDRHVTFRLRAPEASSVVLSGEFMRGT
jgi:hypothetical protein